MWQESEISKLKELFPKYGTSYCAQILGKNSVNVRRKAKELNLENKKAIKNINFTKEILEKICKNSSSIGEVLEKIKLRKAGGNYRQIRKYITEYEIDVSHFVDPKENLVGFNNNKIDLVHHLVENSSFSRAALKSRLLKEGYLKNECSICGQDENWKGVKISLVLDHINGVWNDNRLENLRMVCPNCNAGLDTFANKNRRDRSSVV